MKCKNCSEDISDDFARNVSKHVVSAMPTQQQQVQERIKEVIKYPPEMQFGYCKDCKKLEKNPDYREPTLECNNCDAKLDASRAGQGCLFCGSDEIEEQGWSLFG